MLVIAALMLYIGVYVFVTHILIRYTEQWLLDSGRSFTQQDREDRFTVARTVASDPSSDHDMG